jgi:DNA-binding PadR family transcriptional regulator
MAPLPAPDRPEQLIPLNPRVYAIMVAIADGPCHGYRIKQDVESRSQGLMQLDPGSLYRAIAKLVRDGLIEEVPGPTDTGRGDARRRYYGLTPLGRGVGEAETRRLNSLIGTRSARTFLRDAS